MWPFKHRHKWLPLGVFYLPAVSSTKAYMMCHCGAVRQLVV